MITGEELKKALDLCSLPVGGVCKLCPLNNSSTKCTTELTNSAAAYIDRLENDLAISRKETKRYVQRRTEVITEFAKRLSEKILTTSKDVSLFSPYTFEIIERTVKEMAGDKNEN